MLGQICKLALIRAIKFLFAEITLYTDTFFTNKTLRNELIRYVHLLNLSFGLLKVIAVKFLSVATRLVKLALLLGFFLAR
jgi:hypothetical protein